MLFRGTIHRGYAWSRMDETPQSGILEGELETDLQETVLTGCQDSIRSLEETAPALYSTGDGEKIEYEIYR